MSRSIRVHAGLPGLDQAEPAPRAGGASAGAGHGIQSTAWAICTVPPRSCWPATATPSTATPPSCPTTGGWLSPLGIEQVTGLAERLRDRRVARVYTSTLQRAVESGSRAADVLGVDSRRSTGCTSSRWAPWPAGRTTTRSSRPSSGRGCTVTCDGSSPAGRPVRRSSPLPRGTAVDRRPAPRRDDAGVHPRWGDVVRGAAAVGDRPRRPGRAEVPAQLRAGRGVRGRRPASRCSAGPARRTARSSDPQRGARSPHAAQNSRCSLLSMPLRAS